MEPYSRARPLLNPIRTTRKVGEMMGITHQAVTKLEKAAFRKIKASLRKCGYRVSK